MRKLSLLIATCTALVAFTSFSTPAFAQHRGFWDLYTHDPVCFDTYGNQTGIFDFVVDTPLSHEAGDASNLTVRAYFCGTDIPPLGGNESDLATMYHHVDIELPPGAAVTDTNPNSGDPNSPDIGSFSGKGVANAIGCLVGQPGICSFYPNEASKAYTDNKGNCDAQRNIILSSPFNHDTPEGTTVACFRSEGSAGQGWSWATLKADGSLWFTIGPIVADDPDLRVGITYVDLELCKYFGSGSETDCPSSGQKVQWKNGDQSTNPQPNCSNGNGIFGVTATQRGGTRAPEATDCVAWEGRDTPTAANGKIAFYSESEVMPSIPAIFSMNADGSNRTGLAIAFSAQSSWSPDGTKIAFVDFFNPYLEGGFWFEKGDIYIMDADGRNQRRLTSIESIPYVISGVSWSPDGTEIAFTSDHEDDDEQYKIYAVNVESGNIRRLANDPESIYMQPDWSPDGGKIAFRWARDNLDYEDSDIYVMSSDGTGSAERLTNDSTYDGQPDWSPNGREIVFTSKRDDNYEVYKMDANGDNQRNLSNNSAEYDVWPEYSPDGREIVFHSDRDNEDSREIYIMNADGSGQHNVSQSPDTTDMWPSWQPLTGKDPDCDGAPFNNALAVNRFAVETNPSTPSPAGWDDPASPNYNNSVGVSRLTLRGLVCSTAIGPSNAGTGTITDHVDFMLSKGSHIYKNASIGGDLENGVYAGSLVGRLAYHDASGNPQIERTTATIRVDNLDLRWLSHPFVQPADGCNRDADNPEVGQPGHVEGRGLVGNAPGTDGSWSPGELFSPILTCFKVKGVVPLGPGTGDDVPWHAWLWKTLSGGSTGSPSAPDFGRQFLTLGPIHLNDDPTPNDPNDAESGPPAGLTNIGDGNDPPGRGLVLCAYAGTAASSSSCGTSSRPKLHRNGPASDCPNGVGRYDTVATRKDGARTPDFFGPDVANACVVWSNTRGGEKCSPASISNKCLLKREGIRKSGLIGRLP